MPDCRESVVVRPGDTLLVVVPHQATPTQVAELRDGLKREISDVDVVVLTAQQLVVYRPGGDVA